MTSIFIYKDQSGSVEDRDNSGERSEGLTQARGDGNGKEEGRDHRSRTNGRGGAGSTEQGKFGGIMGGAKKYSYPGPAPREPDLIGPGVAGWGEVGRRVHCPGDSNGRFYSQSSGHVTASCLQNPTKQVSKEPR